MWDWGFFWGRDGLGFLRYFRHYCCSFVCLVRCCDCSFPCLLVACFLFMFHVGFLPFFWIIAFVLFLRSRESLFLLMCLRESSSLFLRSCVHVSHRCYSCVLVICRCCLCASLRVFGFICSIFCWLSLSYSYFCLCFVYFPMVPLYAPVFFSLVLVWLLICLFRFFLVVVVFCVFAALATLFGLCFCVVVSRFWLSCRFRCCFYSLMFLIFKCYFCFIICFLVSLILPLLILMRLVSSSCSLCLFLTCNAVLVLSFLVVLFARSRRRVLHFLPILARFASRWFPGCCPLAFILFLFVALVCYACFLVLAVVLGSHLSC